MLCLNSAPSGVVVRNVWFVVCGMEVGSVRVGGGEWEWEWVWSGRSSGLGVGGAGVDVGLEWEEPGWL